MLKRLFWAALIALPLALMPTAPAGQAPALEDAKTRLGKQEIIDLIVKTGRIPRQEREIRIEAIWKSENSKTPRPDFMFCTGLAYLGNAKAQACLGRAFEKGYGIVEDLYEAYTWYSVALENPIADKALEQQAQESKDRVQRGLQSGYPAPTDDELEDLVKQQVSRIVQYKEEAKKAGN